MKLQCDIVKDLIPLMEDDVCSVKSREAVLEHIRDCNSCRQFYENGSIQPALKLSADETSAQQSVMNGLRKIRKRWIASILLAVLFVPAAFLGWGQLSGRGISFTNINEMMISYAFLRDIKQGNYEGAVRYLDLESTKERWLMEWFDEEKLENIEEDAKRVFCESASLLTEAGGIKEFQFLAIDKQADYYEVYYTVVISGTEQKVTLAVNDNGIGHLIVDGSFLDDPLARLAEWSEYLWQEYEGCRYDPETMQYVYLK